MSSSLWSHELQHTRLTSPSPSPKFAQTHVHWNNWSHPTISSCHPVLLLPSIFPGIRVFSNESALRIRWPKYWTFSFSISPSNEYSELISFRIDWFDLLAFQGTLKVFSKTTVQNHQFFGTQPSLWYNSHSNPLLLGKAQLWLYGPLSAVISLLFNMLSRFDIAFLPRK